MNKVLTALDHSAYSLILLLSALLTFSTGAFMGEKHLGFGLGMGLIAAVVSYRLLEHRESTDGQEAAVKRGLLSLAALTLNVLITGPDTLTPAVVFITVGAMALGHTLRRPAA